LKPLVGGPDEQSSKHRQNEDRRILERPPRAIKQERNEAVLDEMKPLDDVDVRIAGGLSQRVPDGNDEGGGNRAVT